jgi:hypothetical protein
MLFLRIFTTRSRIYRSAGQKVNDHAGFVRDCCIWAFIRTVVFFGFFSFLIGAAVGYGVGEGISLASNRKRGTSLSIIAGIAVVVSYVISIVVPWGRPFFYFDIITIVIGVVVAVTRLR